MTKFARQPESRQQGYEPIKAELSNDDTRSFDQQLRTRIESPDLYPPCADFHRPVYELTFRVERGEAHRSPRTTAGGCACSRRLSGTQSRMFGRGFPSSSHPDR